MFGNCHFALFYWFSHFFLHYHAHDMSCSHANLIPFFASYGALSAATRRDNKPRSDRTERRVANSHAHSKFRHPDDPHGGYRPLPSERRLAAHVTPHRSIDLGPLRDYSVFQFFYLECNSRWPVRDPGERRENAGDHAKIHPAEESQQQHDGESTCGRAI